MPTDGWMIGVFVVITVAVLLQMLILAAMFFQFRQTSREVHQVAVDIQKKIDPLLFRFGRIVENSEEKISSIVSDAAEITRLARGQAQKIDRVVTDTLTARVFKSSVPTRLLPERSKPLRMQG